MHRRVRDRLEDILAGAGGNAGQHGSEAKGLEAARHLDECADCRQTVAALRDQQRMLRSLRAPEEVEPKAGFYARVIERIESQGVASIWSLFSNRLSGAASRWHPWHWYCAWARIWCLPSVELKQRQAVR